MGSYTHALMPQTISTIRKGAIKRWSTTLIPTAREAPSDAETPSHIMLTRAGFIRRVGAGIYDYLPLAWRSLMKISDIVREEMEAAGASEMLMPALEPIEYFAGTKRDIDYGDLLFKLTDRHGRQAALGPTHEEIITEAMIGSCTSYRQLPLSLYQIQTKFRDEARPRAGLLRCREFIMKDAYSFHLNVEGPGGLNEAYDRMYTAYSNVFTRCGLDFTVVEAESGPIGGSASHEFMVNAQTGEDTILVCPVSGYAANVEKCEIGERKWGFDGAGDKPLTEVHTPNLPGIHEVAARLDATPPGMLKTIVFEAIGTDACRWVLAVVRGDHEANEGKVKAVAGCAVVLADEKKAKEAGFAIGYVSPRVINTIPGVRLVVDHDAAQGSVAWATGADRKDYHVTGFNWLREMGPVLHDSARVLVADIRNAQAGDPSPRAQGALLEARRGIEVGHIFKLGTKYSEAMGFAILDANQKKQPVIMGCYGIGVSRTLAASVEQNHDEHGILWPAPIAPYHVHIVLMKPGDAAQEAACAALSAALSEAGIDVLIDDRDERPGVKFKDADLVGLPVRLTLGDKALAAGGVEYKLRKDVGKGEVVPHDAVVQRCLADLA
ncbi:MAG: proline--tRNA ligase [Phycisphaeraceae bacterium]|nr:proline--tRNA ligase [Phycisphaeraceae bacterium]